MKDNTNFMWKIPNLGKNHGLDDLTMSQLDKENIHKRINSLNTNLL